MAAVVDAADGMLIRLSFGPPCGATLQTPRCSSSLSMSENDGLAGELLVTRRLALRLRVDDDIVLAVSARFPLEQR